jgi:DNA polymerase-4
MFVDASILHADLDSFYASVEQRDDPTLRGRPVIVGGGVVLAASYEAKAYGVRTAMGGAQARRLCPHAVVVAPRMTAYMRASDAVFEVFRGITPLVEAISVDEAFLDVSGLRRVSGTPVQVADRLRAEVRERVGLPITVGIARTKFLAKLASQQAKPDGLLLVPPGQEVAFLRPLPVSRLWGVGAKTAAKLHAHGIHTVADVAELSESTLASILGVAMGRQLYALSRNIDRRRVTTGVRRRSVGAQRAVGRAGNSMSPTEIDAVVLTLIDRITARMRAAGRAAPAVRRLHPGHPVAYLALRDILDATHPRHRPAAGRRRSARDRGAWVDAGRVRGLRYRPQLHPAAVTAVHRGADATAGHRRGGR